ncbi:MAG: hypothetical protein HRT89_03015 [Lentisphaeria bacterium]|nr:hypothetical protein [Lentisphaeria bacterium]NQZ67020.1 hypothetical protein [Lentisphaeria bacterium]
MKNLIITMLLLSAFNCFGKWTNIPLNKIVERSQIIVIGKLINVKTESKNKVDYGEGFISVQTVLKGKLDNKKKLKLIWSHPQGLSNRIDHANKTKLGIWLLQIQKDGTVRADYPRRYLPIDKRKEIEDLIKKEKQ